MDVERKGVSDVLFMTDTKAGEMVRRTFQAHMYIVCVALLFLGIIGAVVLVARLQKKVMLIRKGLAEAMTSGEPVDGQALALLMGEKEDNLQQYRMLPVEPDPSETPEDWSEMMMDFDNDANAQSDKAMTKEEMWSSFCKETGLDPETPYDAWPSSRKMPISRKPPSFMKNT